MHKKIFLIGDFASNTGPAIANKALIKALGNCVKHSKAKTKIGRIAELVYAVIISDVVCFCGFSELNVYGVKLAKLFKKKSVYWMHGYVELEAKINNWNINQKRINAEHYILENVDEIICVSHLLADKVMDRYPRKNNIHVVYNIVEHNYNVDSKKKNPLQIMSTGGGMLQKNNITVCKAIEKINANLPKEKRYKYVIIGKPYGMEEKFKKYDFVSYYGEVSQKKCLELMRESSIYIQNSFFETFGMALIEAVGCGCDVIISKNVGAKEVIDGLNSRRIINNAGNIDELSRKILEITSGETEKNFKVNWQIMSKKEVSNLFKSLLGII